jgi:ABC-2 type transport system ATP-binding protein
VDAITAQDLRKRYGDVQALDGLTFGVREGEVFGLLGPNGAGKSTTVRVLTTLTKPDSGQAFVAGQDVVRHPNRARSAFGYVPQESGIDREATGRENLMLQGRIYGMRGAELRRRADELLRLVGLAEAADRVVRGYSGGMKRRLDIGLGLVHRPSVLFLDEPTTGLDPEARAAMWVEVQRLAEQERLTILLTTHYLEEADQLADRLAIVSRGQIVVEGTPADLKRGLHGELVTVELHETNGHVGEALALVERFDGAHETSADGKHVRTRVPDGAQAIPGLLSAFDAAGIPVAAVTTSRPSLDDVYLHYTGREFTADDSAGTSA